MVKVPASSVEDILYGIDGYGERRKRRASPSMSIFASVTFLGSAFLIGPTTFAV